MEQMTTGSTRWPPIAEISPLRFVRLRLRGLSQRRLLASLLDDDALFPEPNELCIRDAEDG